MHSGSFGCHIRQDGGQAHRDDDLHQSIDESNDEELAVAWLCLADGLAGPGNPGAAALRDR
jgi:hypothetical protein